VNADDLVELALDPRSAPPEGAAAAREFDEIRLHLRLHDRFPAIDPDPAIWRRLRAEIEREATAPRRLPRYWTAAAAALLVLAALLFREAPAPAPLDRLHGDVTVTAGGEGRCATLSRVRLGSAVTITFDANTTFVLESADRLVLRAGRLLFQGRAPFEVSARDVTVRTVATVFSVELVNGAVSVAVEEGSVAWSRGGARGTLAAGRRARFFEEVVEEPAEGGIRGWLSEPTISAELADAGTLRVVFGNAMPDAIELAPPTGGEPLLYATYAGHSYPLPAGSFGDRPVRIEPGGRLELLLPLPLRVPPDATVEVVYRDKKATIGPRR
jgi:hypothetical protein